MRPGLRLQDQKKLTKFETVRQAVAEEHDLKNPDVVVDMATVKVTEDMHLEIPNLGVYNMTDWARSQLGTILGVQWNKWFDPKIVDAKDVQEELQKRFRRTHDSRKLRTKRFRKGAPGVDKCDGYLRGVMSPTYHPIDDEKIFDRFEKKFTGQLENFSFMKNHLHNGAGWGNDHANYYQLVTNEPVNLGAIDRNHPDPHVRQIYDLAEREGKLPDNDYVYPGMSMRNSEVGYTAVIIDEFTFRLVCLNGAIVAVGDSRLMYRQHRPIEDSFLDQQLNNVFNKVPLRWENTKKNLNILCGIIVADPVKEIERQLTKLEATKGFITAAQESFKLEPIATMYGILQAITRASQTAFGTNIDKRYEMETMAGQLINNASRLQLAAA